MLAHMRIHTQRLALAAAVAAFSLSGCGSSHGTAPAAGDPFGVLWTPAGASPALAAPPCPAADCFGMGDPCLLAEPGGGWSMWYTAGGTGGGPFVMRASVSSGLVPTQSPATPVLPIAAPGTWDRFVETPSVVRDSTDRHLWMTYLGYADTGYVAPAIGLMRSNDTLGVDWARPAAPIYRPPPGGWDAALVTGPNLVRAPGGEWRIYYTGAGTTVGIGLLTSPDGVTWTPYANAPVFERRIGQWDEATLEPCVRFVNGRWWLWYSGYREPLSSTTRIGIGLAVSDDGVHWTRVGTGPVLDHGTTGAWNDLSVLSPDVVQEADGTLLMAAYGLRTTDPGVNAGSIAFWRSRPATP